MRRKMDKKRSLHDQATEAGRFSLGDGFTHIPPPLTELYDSLRLIEKAAEEDWPRLKLRSGIPELLPQLAELPALRSLDIAMNSLVEFSPEIAQLTHLRELNLSENSLTTLPPEIAQLS